jgi:putative flippase GtrA
VIKSFLIESSVEVESIVDVQSINDVESENVQSTESSFDDENQNLASEIQTRFIRTRRLSLRYQNFADITVFLQDEDDSSLIFVLNSLLTFAESRRKEINDLLKRQVFEIIIISEVFKNVRIFNSRFVDEIKHSDTSQAYEKSRLMIQTYNDHEKTLMLTQALIIQRMSQRIILVIAASINHHLYLRNITQTYTQSKSSLNRMFFIRSSFDLNLSDDVILRIIKLLYDVSEIETH